MLSEQLEASGAELRAENARSLQELSETDPPARSSATTGGRGEQARAGDLASALAERLDEADALLRERLDRAVSEAQRRVEERVDERLARASAR